MSGEVMSNEEDYAFDVAGYLHVPGALKSEEVKELNRALDGMKKSTGMLGWPVPQRDPFRDLLVHPKLVWYLNQIMGHGFRLDQAPQLLGYQEGEVGDRKVKLETNWLVATNPEIRLELITSKTVVDQVKE